MPSLDFPGGSDGKAPVYDVGDPGSIPGLGRSTGEGNGNSLQYSGLENSMDCISMGLQRVLSLSPLVFFDKILDGAQHSEN